MTDQSARTLAGSWEQLVSAASHAPYGGGNHSALTDNEAVSRAEAVPIASLWSMLGPHAHPDLAVAIVLSAVQAKQVAASIPDTALQGALAERADRTIAEFTDDICGTGPHRIPWPWPGPPPWAFAIIGRLVAVANTIQEDSVRHSMLEIAVGLTHKIYASAGTGVGNPP